MVHAGRCAEHLSQRRREDNARRADVISTYSGRWPKARSTFLARPENRSCRILGPTCTGAATLVDHRIPWRSGRTEAERQALFWDTTGNWQPACFNCHNAKTVRDDQHRNADGTFGRARG